MPSRPARSAKPTSCNPWFGAQKTPRWLLQLLCQQVFSWPCPATALHGESLRNWASTSLTTPSISPARSGRRPDGRGTWCCEDTDYSVCARLCAVCLGAYLADSQAFCRKGRSCGVQYEDLCHGGGQGFKVAVSARLATRMPTLPLLLRALAEVPRGSFAFYSEHRLGKVFRKAKTSREVLKMAILSLLPDRATADKKVQGVYRTVAAFSSLHAVVKSGAGCPGHP